jgi:hypothetical protein
MLTRRILDSSEEKKKEWNSNLPRDWRSGCILGHDCLDDASTPALSLGFGGGVGWAPRSSRDADVPSRLD